MNDIILEWEAYDRAHERKSADWYIALAIIAASLVITALILNNILLAIFIVASIFGLLSVMLRPPSIVTCQIREQGIQINELLYPWQNIKSFWVNEHGRVPSLTITVERFMLPHLFVPIDEVDPQMVRDIVRSRGIKEENNGVTIAERLFEALGFY